MAVETTHGAADSPLLPVHLLTHGGFYSLINLAKRLGFSLELMYAKVRQIYKPLPNVRSLGLRRL